jgi:hypothetical protein
MLYATMYWSEHEMVLHVESTVILYRFWKNTLLCYSVLRHLRSVRRLLVTASVVPSPQILVSLMKEALNSSETSVLTRVTRRNIPEDTILHVRFEVFTAWLWRMASSGMLHRVALVRAYDSEELSASLIRVTRIGELEMYFFAACIGC